MGSLRARLGLALTAALVVVVIAQWALVSVAIRSVSEDYVASRLEHDAEALLGALVVSADNSLQLRGGRVSALFKRPFSGHYFQIRAGESVLRSRSLWDQALDAPQPAAGERRRVHLVGPQDQPLLAVSARYRKGGEAVTVTVAEDLSAVEGDIAAFRWRYTLVSVAVLAGLIAVQLWVVTRTLRPLGALRRALGRLLDGEIQTLDTRVPAEVRPLVDELNRLLATTAQRLERYRHATGNLAHALKTPLARLQQLAGDPALEHLPELRQRIATQVDDVRALAERELKRARLAGGVLPGERADLAAVVDDLIGALEQIYRDKALRIERALPAPAEVAVDREDLTELLGNLLDNACKWADGRVRVSAADEPALAIQIEDDGPGADVETLERLSRRGQRGDEAVAGHGLGLAIAADIARQYGGELRFTRSRALGGVAVTAALPVRASLRASG